MFILKIKKVKKLMKKYVVIMSLFSGIFMIFLSIYLVIQMIVKGSNYIYSNEIIIVLLILVLIGIARKTLLDKYENVKSQKEYRNYLINELELNKPYAPDKNSSDESEKEDNNINVEPIYEDCDSTIINEQKKDGKKDILALMLKNNDEITDYFKISKSQARSSFWFSVVFCIVGLVCLVFGIYGIVNLKDVSISIISLISGSLSEFISATIFWLHNKSALQLNHYYEALHENEKFLSAVNIADKLCDERREEMLVEIIRNQISAKPSKNETENNK